MIQAAFDTAARLFGLYPRKGTIAPGADADITVLDPDREWVFERRDTASKSQNNPFYGWTLKGKPTATIVAGKIVWRE